VAQVVANGVTFPTPVALSRDQQVDLKVITYDELIRLTGLLSALAVGLLLVGRGRQMAAALGVRGMNPLTFMARLGRARSVQGKENVP
jgi:hypothetical protein